MDAEEAAAMVKSLQATSIKAEAEMRAKGASARSMRAKAARRAALATAPLEVVEEGSEEAHDSPPAAAGGPNGDGTNDYFFPVFDCSIRNYFITITDRWGNIVFQSEDPYQQWDGSNAPLGVYSVRVFYQGLNEQGQTVGDNLAQTLTVIQ